MFNLGLSVSEKIFRTALVYFALMIGLRLSGKRELAQLNPFDLIVLLMLSNTVQNAIIGDDNTVTGGLLGAAALLALNYAVVRIVYASPWLQRLIGGAPDVLILHGKVRKHNLERELITPEELDAAAHRQGIASLAEVDKCVLEPTGTLSFIPRKPTGEDRRHDELLKRFDAVVEELIALRASKSSRKMVRQIHEFRGAAGR
jgi:uncharacterized membrane protein YcaP (DUF421 family)